MAKEKPLKVVQYLKDQPLVEKVNHPSISEDKEQQELYKKYFPNGGGSIYSGSCIWTGTMAA